MPKKVTYNEKGLFALKPPKPHEYPEWRIRANWNDTGECCYYQFEGGSFKARLYIDEDGTPSMKDVEASEGVQYRIGDKRSRPRLCAVKSDRQSFMFSWDAEERWRSWAELCSHPV